MKLVCGKCNSENIDKHGEKSKLDGKQGYRCMACECIMGPIRNRVVLIFLMVVALGLTAFGLVWAVLLINSMMKHSVELAGSWIQGAFWTCVFLGVGSITFWALLKAYRQITPKRIAD